MLTLVLLLLLLQMSSSVRRDGPSFRDTATCTSPTERRGWTLSSAAGTSMPIWSALLRQRSRTLSMVSGLSVPRDVDQTSKGFHCIVLPSTFCEHFQLALVFHNKSCSIFCWGYAGEQNDENKMGVRSGIKCLNSGECVVDMRCFTVYIFARRVYTNILFNSA